MPAGTFSVCLPGRRSLVCAALASVCPATVADAVDQVHRSSTLPQFAHLLALRVFDQAVMYTCLNGTWPVKCVVIMIMGEKKR
jgi:hypothetical protein